MIIKSQVITKSITQGLLFFLLCLFVFFSTFSIAGAQSSLAMCLFVWLILLISGRSAGWHRTILDIPIALFVIVSLLSAVFSYNPSQATGNLKNLLLVSIIYLIGFNVPGRKQRSTLLIILAISGTASALFGVITYFLGMGEGALGRTPGPFSTAMTYGGVLLLLCSCFLALGMGEKLRKKDRIIFLSCAITGLAALFYSFTRSSWLGMFVSAVIIFAYLKRRWLPWMIAAVVVVIILLPSPYQDRIRSIFDPQFRTNVQRINMLKGSAAMFRDHWLSGVGTVDLAEKYREYKPEGAEHIHGHMHNIFLQIAVTRGILGLITFCYFIVSCFRLILSNLRLDLPPPGRALVVGSLGALAGFLVNGLFEWNFGDAEVIMLLYTLLGFNLSISISSRSGKRVDYVPAPEDTDQ